MTASQFKKKFGLTTPQGAILMRAYNEERHNYVRWLHDRSDSVDLLTEYGYFKEVSDLNDEEKKAVSERIEEIVRQVHELTVTSEKWKEARELLNEAARLNNSKSRIALKLTPKAMELAAKIAADGLEATAIWLLK
jgi:hypothetical protein